MGFVHPLLGLAPLPEQAYKEIRTTVNMVKNSDKGSMFYYLCPSSRNNRVGDILVTKVNGTEFSSNVRSCIIHSESDLL
jgi:hypothetical protein